MRLPKSWVVFITGCSSGLGNALALEFAERGHNVFATARNIEDIDALKTERITVLPLDVTDTSSISVAVQKIWERTERIDILVNNAGFGLMGPLTEIPLGEVRLQFETNVLAPLAMIQAVIPYMVRQGSGRIVNVGSASGVLATPFSGAYSASKAALHSLSDAMRMEMAPFGIEVITLQPGKIVSKFGDTAVRMLRELIHPDSLFSPIFRFMENRALASQSGATEASLIARQIVLAVTKARPPRVLRLGNNSWMMPFIKWAFPLALTDHVLSRLFGLHLLRQSRKNSKG